MLNKIQSGPLASTLLISIFSVINLALGFLLQIALANRFGAGAAMDVYLAAGTLPLTINLILVGALNVAVVPLLIDYRISHGEDEVWKIISTGINLFLIVTIGIVGVLVISSGTVMRLIAPGLIGSEFFASSSTIFSVLLISTIFTGVATFISSVYYSYKTYFLPSLAFSINNFVVLLLSFLLAEKFGILAIAIGYVAGSLVQVLLLSPVLRHNYHLVIHYRHPGVLRLIMLIIPWIAGSLIGKLNPLVERYIASNFSEGAISHLGYAFMGITAVTIVTGKGLSLTSLSLMSEYTSTGQTKKLAYLLSTTIRLLILFLALVSIWIIGSGEEVVRLLFEHGEFTSNDTQQVSKLLIAYLGYYVFGSIGIVLVNVLYSRQNTVTVAKVNVIGFFVYLGLSITFAYYFGVVGLAAATSVEYGINLLIFFLILKPLFGYLGMSRLTSVTLKAILSATFAFLVSTYLVKIIWNVDQSLLFILLYMGTSGSLYILMLRLLKTDEINIVSQRLNDLVYRTLRQAKHVG